MKALKNAIITSPALISIDYASNRPIFLSIDLSWHGVGWILAQECTNGCCRPACFGFISWNECESRYSQAKVKLYGLFQALHALRLFIVGVKNPVSKWMPSTFAACSRTPTSSPTPLSIGGSPQSCFSTSSWSTFPQRSTMDPTACHSKSLLMTKAKTMTPKIRSTLPYPLDYRW